MFDGGYFYQFCVVVFAIALVGVVIRVSSKVLDKESERLGHRHDH